MRVYKSQIESAESSAAQGIVLYIQKTGISFEF
jgi:hypothetical protein